jgi:integrase
MAAYRKDGTPVVKTIENNIRMLRRVLEVATGRQDVLSLNVSVLTDDLEAKYREACAAGAGADEVRRHRARVSAASTLRQAKSVFARWCLAEYRAAGMQFPESLAGFLAARRRAGSASVKAQAYTRRPDELVRATMDGAERLRLERPDLYAVFCLSYFQGMRAGEIAEARWSWVEQQDGQRVIRICRRPDWRGPKNLKDHSVPMTDDTWAALQAVRGDSPFIVPGASFTARRNLIGRTFAQWMRAVGWDPEVYPKAAHELRKLAGAVWYTKAGLQWAARWLGDTAAVVDHFYAALTNVGAPVDMRAI